MNTYIKSLNFSGNLVSPVYENKIFLFLAWLISFIFHPLFVTVYVTYYLAFIHPHYFSGSSYSQRWIVVIRSAINMVLYPMISVLLLKAVGFIDSVLLRTQKDRVIPYIGCGIFFFWMYLVFRNQPEIPAILTSFTFAVFLSSSAALIANIYYKISMHAIGSGGLIGIMLVILLSNPASPVIIPLIISILIAGLVCTSRMVTGNHTQKEIYGGLLLGLAIQFIAFKLIL